MDYERRNTRVAYSRFVAFTHARKLSRDDACKEWALRADAEKLDYVAVSCVWGGGGGGGSWQSVATTDLWGTGISPLLVTSPVLNFVCLCFLYIVAHCILAGLLSVGIYHI